MSNYQVSKQGLIFLASLEGIGLSKYLDSVGVWTIGLGATRTEIPDLALWPMSKTITLEEAFALLRRSIVKYEKSINLALTTTVTQSQFDALVSICYNIGQKGAANSTFMKRINAGARVGTLSASFFGSIELDAPEVKWNESFRTDVNVTYEATNPFLGMISPSANTIVEAILMWNKPSEIIGRRKKEAKLFSTGNYGDCKITLFPVSDKGRPVYSKGKIVDGNAYL